MDQKLYLETDGQKTIITDFALVYREGTEFTFLGLAEPILLGQAMMCCWSKFYESLAKLNDQDIYEVCMAMDLDFDQVLEQVREVRKNG